MTNNPVSLSPPPVGYSDWLAELKQRIHTAQQRASLQVNQALVLLYWQIGQDILTRQAEQGWGTKVIDRLAHDLRTTFPSMKGFSPRNLKYMRAFAEAWSDSEFVQAVLAQLPWYHQIALLDKLKTEEDRRWYAQKAITHNWSRNVLVMQIETRLLQRQGNAVTNFKQSFFSFPPSSVGMHTVLLSDSVCIPTQERGNELLGFYMTAVDRQIKAEQDTATIGLLLCKSKDKVVAEYALGDKTQPMGIAEYKLQEALPETLETNLPSIEQIERELQGDKG